MTRIVSVVLGATMALGASMAMAQQAAPLLTEKKVFEMPSYTTVGGQTIKAVRVGWEAYGTLNADKSNVILITHFYSANSHAAGKYKPEDAAAGYWDAIIGPGKAVDTNKFYVIASDTLVNLNAKDPMTTTTGPASINPDTGKPYGLSFPVVTIRDFVNVQKALVESLGIKKLHAVMGASMGALQAYEWAASYPQMVGRVIPVIGTGEADGYLIAWLDSWSTPIRLDANWNNGDYYGKAEPTAGLAAALKLVTLHAQHWAWASSPALGRKWAADGKDPAACLTDCKFAVEAALDAAGKARAATSDANHFLYLAKACQLFVAGGRSFADGLKAIDAPVLLITSDDDMVFHRDGVDATVNAIRVDGTSVEQVKVRGGRGHLDGVLHITQAADAIRMFVNR